MPVDTDLALRLQASDHPLPQRCCRRHIHVKELAFLVLRVHLSKQRMRVTPPHQNCKSQKPTSTKTSVSDCIFVFSTGVLGGMGTARREGGNQKKFDKSEGSKVCTAFWPLQELLACIYCFLLLFIILPDHVLAETVKRTLRRTKE